jgi:hypothetical protein
MVPGQPWGYMHMQMTEIVAGGLGKKCGLARPMRNVPRRTAVLPTEGARGVVIVISCSQRATEEMPHFHECTGPRSTRSNQTDKG